MRVDLKVLWIFLLAFLFSGCAGSKDPIGPDSGIPPFSINVSPPVIAPAQNVVLSLTPTLPLDFEDLYGEWIYFSSSSEYGVFFPDSLSLVDPSEAGYLNPPIWFQYGGPVSQDTLVITLYGYVISQIGNTLAWNTCQLAVVPN